MQSLGSCPLSQDIPPVKGFGATTGRESAREFQSQSLQLSASCVLCLLLKLILSWNLNMMALE